MAKIYSYHTFLFPFIFEGVDGKNDERNKIEEAFSNHPYWKSVDWMEQRTEKLNRDQKAADYALYQYFHPAVRKAVFGKDSNIVKNYELKPELLKDEAEYRITKEVSEGYNYDFHLKIDRIFLKLFNTGVAVLGMDCLNQQYDHLDEIKMINDYKLSYTVSGDVYPDHGTAGLPDSFSKSCDEAE